jgi:hypothetical protein
MFGRRTEVVTGQFYRKMDATGYVFEVIGVRRDPLGAMHVQMRRRDEPSTRRTLAADILMDPNEFELIQDVPGRSVGENP